MGKDLFGFWVNWEEFSFEFSFYDILEQYVAYFVWGLRDPYYCYAFWIEERI